MKKKRSLKGRVNAVIILMAVIMAVAACALSYKLYDTMVDNHYKNMAQNLAKTLATAVDKDDVRELRDEVLTIYQEIKDENGGIIPIDSYTEEEWEAYYARYQSIYDLQAYKNLCKVLQEYSRDNGTDSIYLAHLDNDYGIYLVDGSLENASLVGTAEETLDVTREQIKQGSYGMPPNITNYPEYGWICTVAEGVFSDDGEMLGTVAIDISMMDVKMDGVRFLLLLVVIMMIVSTISVFVINILMKRTIIRPIDKLSGAASSFVKDKKEGKEEDVSEISKLQVKTGDELEKLSDSIKQMEKDINTYIRDLTAMTAEKERIDVELNMATEIQSTMVPCVFPAFPSRKEFDIFASMTPAKEVGGDLYDFFLIDEDHLGIVIADVSGKGVPAALFMMVSKALIKNTAMNGSSPAKVFSNVNSQLCENNETNMFVTAWIGILTISSGKMLCANAGHEFPAICRKGGKYELLNDKHGFVLAGFEGSQYQEYEIDLNPGDRFFVYTDGVPEATNAQEQFYETDRMIKALNEKTDLSPEELLRHMKADVDAFVGDAPQFDDLTMLAFYYKGID